MQALDDEGKADEQEKTQRQHFDGGMAIHKTADRSGGNDHHACRDDDGGDHDRQSVNHADGGDHRIERKDDIQQEYLDNDTGKRGADVG